MPPSSTGLATCEPSSVSPMSEFRDRTFVGHVIASVQGKEQPAYAS